MMKIEIATPGKMLSNGSQILRAIQNNNTPIADLFIRESIQNSLDAAIGSNPEVLVDFIIKEFNTGELSKELENINEIFNDKFKPVEKFLCIRDHNTVGLTGALSHSQITDANMYGNLLKLIYDIGKPQTQAGSGGSWGIGKSIFYRMGIGLVFYYTRIKLKNGQYEERLAAVMIEDEKLEECIIPKYKDKVNIGLAWWGQEVSENETIPITNKEYINKLLKVFNIEPYESLETGTAIIMPFINEEQILRNNAYGSEQGEQRLDYYSDLSEYLSYSIQRWYFPRLNNKYYRLGNGKVLKVNINGNPITYDKQEPYFKLMQDLYNYASTNKLEELKYIKNIDAIKREPINLRKTKNTSLEVQEVGNLVFGEFTYEEVGMGSPDLKGTPHFLSNLNKDDNESNDPIITYTRQPGMIINYEDRSAWTKSISPTAKDTFMMGIFVLNSNNMLSILEDQVTLEEYIRQGERADHTSWNDHADIGVNPLIVQRIQTNLVSKIKNEFEEEIIISESDNDGRLSKIFGANILPDTNYGKKASRPREKVTNGVEIVRTKQMSSSLKTRDILYERHKVTVPYEIEIKGDNLNLIEFELRMDTETSSLTIPKYENEIARVSPLSIDTVEMYGKEQAFEFSKNRNDFIVVQSKLGTVYKLEIEKNFKKGESWSVDIGISSKSLDVRPLIKIKGKENVDVEN